MKKVISTSIVIIFLLLVLPYIFMFGFNLISNAIGYYLLNYKQAIIIYYGIIIIKISLLSFYKNKK